MLLVVRHGNTFAPGERAVYVGAHENPDLVEAGERQARALGEALAPWAHRARRFVASPMRRTQTHARLVQQASLAKVAIETHSGLKELDYGSYAGRHKDELEREGFAQGLRLWETRGEYPADAHFAPPRHEVLASLRTWLEQMAAEALLHPNTWSLAVTHGGILRLLGTLVAHEPLATSQMKMACGHVAVLKFEGGQAKVHAWNAPPGPHLTEFLAVSCRT